MALRLFGLVFACGCVQIALANPAGNWPSSPVPARTAWNVPAAFSGSPSWFSAPAGSNIYGAVSPWKTPAAISCPTDYPTVNVREEHPWSTPAIAPAASNTGAPALITPLESNWWSGQNTHSWTVPAIAGALAAPAARTEPQLPAPLQLPTPPRLPASLQLPAPAAIPSSAKVSASSISSNHPLQSPAPAVPTYGPGIAPYAPIEVAYHPLQTPGPILTGYGPGLPPYASIDVPNFPLQNPGTLQPAFFPGIAPYTPLQVPNSPSGPTYGPGIAPYAAILSPVLTH